MLRFVAFAYQDAAPEQQAIVARLKARLDANRTRWTRAFGAAGLEVYCQQDGASAPVGWPLGSNGVLLGTVFSARLDPSGSSYPRLARFTAAQADAVLASAGSELLRLCWGSYVGFITRNGHTLVLRGPASALPCLRTTYGGVQVYFSDVSDLGLLGVVHLSINWKYIRSRLIGPIQTTATGFNEVLELSPGECDELADGLIEKRTLWDPLQICATTIEDLEEAAATVRKTTDACVASWASCFEGILHNLSGGLDSSIVLASLSRARGSGAAACVTYYVDTQGGDERLLARATAKRHNCQLIEHARTPKICLRPMLHARRSHRPETTVARVELAAIESKLARDVGADTVFSGEGGDELFFRGALRYAATDWRMSRGVNRRLLEFVLRTSQHEGTTFWSSLRNTLRSKETTGNWNPLVDQIRTGTLISDGAIVEILQESNDDLIWPRHADRAPPGKVWQAYSLSIPPSYYDSFLAGEGAQSIAPLISQPLIEVCLRIPTYLHAIGGVDRAVARKAFASDVVPSILKRHSKGQVEVHMRDMLIHNLDFARDLLLDGRLVKERLINRDRVESMLSDQPSAGAEGMYEIYWLLTVEAWLARAPLESARVAA